MLQSRIRQFNDYLERKKLRPLADVFLFVLIILVFHKFWWDWGFKDFLINYTGFLELEQYMAYQVFWPSAWIDKHILGYEITTRDTTLLFPNNGYIHVNGSCSGLKQFYQWIFLMVLFPGPWKKKLWFIPMGILIIHLVNIFRIVALSVILMNWPDQWHFSHDWILRPFFYVVIFAMWVIWVERFRNKPRSKSTGGHGGKPDPQVQ